MHLGKVMEATDTRLVVQTNKDFLKKLSRGISVAMDGICLTVISYDKKSFMINFIPETFKRTNIQYLQKNSLVNLELPANSETFLSGHVVQGHVDAVGKIKSIERKGNSRIITFSIPKNISKYIVEKGSITVNGISLTVIDITRNYFTVGIIPHTWDNTMLHAAKAGDSVNLEVDVLAKYLEKLIGKAKIIC